MPKALETKPEVDSTIAPYLDIFYRLHPTRREKYCSIDISQFKAYCWVIQEEDPFFLDQVISTADFLYLKAIREIDEDNKALTAELNSTLKSKEEK